MNMPKTPRRSLRSYLRSAPVIVAQVRDTEIMADIEAMEHPTEAALRRMGQFSERSAMLYRMGKPPRPAWWVRAADCLLKWFINVCVALFLGAVAALAIMAIFPAR